MTRAEKERAINDHCKKMEGCEDCLLYEFTGTCNPCAGELANIDANYAYLFGSTQDSNEVEHPSHYAGDKYECIEVMIEVFGVEFVKDWCIGNAFKYLWRCKKKHDNALTDIKKAKYYLEKHIKLEEGAETDGEQQANTIYAGA